MEWGRGKLLPKFHLVQLEDFVVLEFCDVYQRLRISVFIVVSLEGLPGADTVPSISRLVRA